MDKKTEELINELQDCPSIQDYIQANDSHFLHCTTAEYIGELMHKYGLKKSDIVNHSCLSEVYTYQILSGAKHPERDKLLCLAFALCLSILETNRLLKISGKSELYAKSKRDSILIFALSKKLDIHQANDLLYALEEQTL